METKMKIKDCNSKYNDYTGTECYYKYLDSYLTDGTVALAENEGAYWFMTLIISLQYLPILNSEYFQSWFLTRKDDSSFTVICTNGNYVENIEEYKNITHDENEKNIIYKQNINFSDFKYDRLKLFYCKSSRVLYLPSEY